jgi:hypothetical protein
MRAKIRYRKTHLFPNSPTNLRSDVQGLSRRIDGFHDIQNHVNNGLITKRYINHGVVNGTVRP